MLIFVGSKLPLAKSGKNTKSCRSDTNFYHMFNSAIPDDVNSQVLASAFMMEALEHGIPGQEHARAGLHEIILVQKGAGSIQIDESGFELGSNHLFLLSAGQVYAFAPGSRVKGFRLCFSDSFWDKTPMSARNCKATLFNDARQNQLFVLGKTDAAALTGILQQMLYEYRLDDYSNKPDVLAAYLKILVIKIANINRLLSKETNNYHYQVYQQFQALVADKGYHTHDVTTYARQLGVSSRKLGDICRLYSGKGAKELINDQVMAEARRLLQFTSLPVKAIADQLHFATPYQFSNFFKKEAAMSPMAYKNSFGRIGLEQEQALS